MNCSVFFTEIGAINYPGSRGLEFLEKVVREYRLVDGLKGRKGISDEENKTD